MGRTRTFIGIDINETIRANAVAMQKQLAKTGAEVKWTSPESLHITLLFLGDVDDRELHSICKAVKHVAARESPFTLRVAGIGAFPTPRRPKVLWCGITEGAEPLQRLHAALEEQMLELGCYRKEERGYTPHLTLGRVKGDSDSFALATEIPKQRAWDGGHATIEDVFVYSSEANRDGPVYTIIGRAALGANI